MKSIFIIFLSSISAVFSSGILSDDFEHGSNVRSVRHYPDMDSTSCESVSSEFNGHKIFTTVFVESKYSYSNYCYNHGSLLWSQGNKTEAMNTWWIAANSGNLDALFNIALAHTWPHKHSAFFNYDYGYSLLSDLSLKGHHNSTFVKAKLDFLNHASSCQEKINAVTVLHNLRLKGHVFATAYLDEIWRDLENQSQAS